MMPATATGRNQDFVATRPLSPNSFRPPLHDPPFVHAPYENNSLINQAYNLNDWSLPHFNGFPVPLPPRPVAQQVWILDCKSCGAFLTNRGMKAVLLLHPNVSLYSTDALPINCSAYTSNPEALRPLTSHPRPDNRTCECLTQTLCCHGCGTAVGYMIVVPCNRCTGSTTATNRTTNGHRFIFHSSEVAGTERHFVLNDPGVIPFDPPQDLPMGGSHEELRSQSTSQRLPREGLREDTVIPSSRQLHHSHGLWGPGSFHASSEVKEPCQSRKLEPGDLLFWHHLSKYGEIPGVADDFRARGKKKALLESS